MNSPAIKMHSGNIGLKFGWTNKTREHLNSLAKL